MRGPGGRRIEARVAGGATLGRFEVRDGFLGRMRGLLGTGRSATPILIARCRSIHCMGMRYAIDVAFLDVGGRVLLARRGLVPGSLLGCRFAAGVLERPEGPGPWPCDGDLVELSELPGEIAPARAKGV